MAETPSASRLTVVDTVYYQAVGLSPVSEESRFSRLLKTDEQVYVRHLFLEGSPWKEVETGWIVAPSMVHIKNLGQKDRQTQPTPEEILDESASVLEIGIICRDFGSNGGYPVITFAQVLPGESCRFHPLPGRKYYVRCLGSSLRCLITIFPG